MVLTKWDELVEDFKLEPADVSSRYKIPIRTVYAWYSHSRKPPEYMIDMIRRLEEQRNGSR